MLLLLKINIFMNKLRETSNLFLSEFKSIGDAIVNYLPNLILAILIVIIG